MKLVADAISEGFVKLFSTDLALYSWWGENYTTKLEVFNEEIT